MYIYINYNYWSTGGPLIRQFYEKNFMEITLLGILFVGVCGYIIAKNIEKGWIKPIKKRLNLIEKRLLELEKKNK